MKRLYVKNAVKAFCLPKVKKNFLNPKVSQINLPDANPVDPKENQEARPAEDIVKKGPVKLLQEIRHPDRSRTRQ